MSPRITDELRAALRAHTDDVTAAPALAARVRATAARRHRRRTRAALALTPLVVVGVLVTAVTVLPRPGGGPVPAAADEALLARPTGGDLAGSADYLDTVTRVFLAGVRPPVDGPAPTSTAVPDTGPMPAPMPTVVPGTEPAGDPHVLWAGTTPAGPAAVVVQKERTPAGPVVAIGYVGDAAGTAVLVAVSRPGDDDLAGVFVAPRVVLAVDRGQPLTWSYEHTYRPGGGIVLADRPVVFADGVAVLAVPADVNPRRVELTRPGSGRPDPARVLRVGGDPGTEAPDTRLRWESGKSDFAGALHPVAGADRWPVPKPDPSGPDRARYDQVKWALRNAVDALPTERLLYGSNGDDHWYAYGATPDGRRLVATDMAADGFPSRAYVALIDAAGQFTVVVGGPITPADPVPVRVELPAGQGWLVVAKDARLSWRAGDGPWTDTGADAALLPPTATQIRADDGPATDLR